MTNITISFHAASLCVLVIGLAGCSTTTNRMNEAQLGLPIKMLVMESPISIDPGRLQAVLAPNLKSNTSESGKPITRGIDHAEEYAMASMKTALGNQPGLKIIPLPAQANQTIKRIRASSFDSTITQNEADWLQKTTGADALFRFDITDYGLTPRAWRKGYITFEVTSTLAIAAVIAYSGSTAAKAAAGTYLAQEAAEETAEAYAGFWALDVISRPVRIEAKLVQLNPLETVWQTSATGLSDTSLSRLTRKVPAKEEKRQLDQSTDDAASKVNSALLTTLKDIKGN
jgi:hypothetical protein